MKKEITKFSFCYGESNRSVASASETTLKKYKDKVVETSVYKTGDGLEAIRTKTEFEDFDAVYIETEFLNNSSKVSENISNISDIDMTFDTSDVQELPTGYMSSDIMPTVFSTRGSLCMKSDFAQIVKRIFKGKETEFRCSGGRSSNDTMPFFTYKQGNEGYVIALGWSGQWKLVFSRDEGNVFVKGGIENADFPLYPNERIRTASAIILHFTGAVENGQNAFRRLIKNHFSIIGQGERDKYAPLSVLGWGGMSSEKMVERIEEFKRYELGFEYYWVDAGWYGESTLPCPDEHTGDWGNHTGNWCINKTYHSDGFRTVTDKLKEVNMKFLLWFEPERVVKSTPIAKEHPEMLLNIDKSPNSLINLGSKEAQSYIFDILSEKIESLSISCLRVDFNINPLDFWLKNDKQGEKGKTEVLYINGLYKLLDSLLERFPHLIIDNCASGGRRIDIEMLKRTVPLSISDYECGVDYDVEASQFQMIGISKYIPYFGIATAKVPYDTYRIRSTYAPSMQNCCWGYEKTSFDGADMERIDFVKRMNAEYKRVRPYYSSDFYRLIEATVYDVHASRLPFEYENADDTTWTAYQFDRPEENDGLIGFFRRRKSPFDRCTVELRAIDENAAYTLEDLDTGDIAQISGKELKYFIAVLPERCMAKLYIYTKISK